MPEEPLGRTDRHWLIVCPWNKIPLLGSSVDPSQSRARSPLPRKNQELVIQEMGPGAPHAANDVLHAWFLTDMGVRLHFGYGEQCLLGWNGILKCGFEINVRRGRVIASS